MKIVLAVVLAAVGVPWMARAQDQSGAHNRSANSHLASVQDEHGSMHHGPNMKIDFENDQVQVMRVHIGPHEKIPMHDISSPRVQVLLTDEHLRITFPNGETKEESHKAGETFWLQPQRHAGQNLSDSPLEFVIIVPKK